MLRKFRLPLRLIVPAGLVALVALLATLQYRWVGQVSEAERAQKQKSLHERAESFAEDFDRELSRLYSSFQSDGAELAAGNVETYARHLESWRERARFPEMLRALYLIDPDAPDAIREYRPAEKDFVTISWPADLADVRKSLSPAPATPPPSPDAPRRATFVPDAMLPSVPALRVTLPKLMTSAPMGSGSFVATSVMAFSVSPRFLIAALNREHLQSTVLPALAAQYFPDRDSDSYRFAVIDAKAPASPVFSKNVAEGAALDPAHADASVPLFSLRLDLVTFARSVSAAGAGGGPRGGGSGARGSFGVVEPNALQGLKVDTFSTTTTAVPPPHTLTGNSSFQMVIQARGTQPNDVLTVTPRALTGWQLVLQHTAGSLDAAVSQVRRRNLWLSFGVLAVLMVSVGFVLVSAQRAERLAGQQMDFVATVSHELRTPLAVIRSAAQNMSAGVVHDAGQAKRYGDLIETEGRRLTDMVEQVLEYAGIGGNRRPVRTAVDVGSLVRDVVASCQDLLASSSIDVTFDIADNLPAALGEEDALRRALHNLVTNAVKYGADGRTIRLAVTRETVRGRDELHASVTDHGRGIDPDDIAHIFEPFYRGRYAIDRQIRGNGLGLSLVKRIAEAHGGRVTVTSTPGEGATFTLHLPVAAAAPAARSVATLASSEAMPQK